MVENRAADGAEAEYLAALDIPLKGRNGGFNFPLELLAPPERRAEDRATTDTDTTTMPRRWLDRLFAGTAAESVGITMESVPAGVSSHPVTTAGASAAQRQRSARFASRAASCPGPFSGTGKSRHRTASDSNRARCAWPRPCILTCTTTASG